MWSVDERDGLAETLRQSESLVQDKQATISHLEGQTAALQSEISALRLNKDDVCLLCIDLQYKQLNNFKILLTIVNDFIAADSEFVC